MTTMIIGAGLVGSQIAQILVTRGERPVLFDRAVQAKALGEIVDTSKVTLVEGDVLRPLSLTQAIRAHQVTKLIHMAANANLTLGAMRDPYGAIELNIMGTANVLEAARGHGIAKVVVASSSVLVHHVEGGDGTHDVTHEEGLPRPISIYSTCKQAVENIGLNYCRYHGVDFGAMRYGAVCGPWNGEGGGGPSKTFLGIVLDALHGREAVIPSAAIEWVYSKDAASGTVAVLDAKLERSRIFNLTMGTLTTAQDLVAAVKAAVPGARTRIETPPPGPAMKNMDRPADIGLAKRVLGWAPAYQVREAVADMVHWARANVLK